MSEPAKNSYTEIRAINVNEHTEKKGKLTYLSWAWAVDILMQRDENASWEYDEHKIFPDETMMVFCTVEAFGRKRKMQLPVMDNMNKPIKNPNAFQVNTAMHRCLAKAIALHGLGLYIYAGEDVPDVDVPDNKQNLREDAADLWPIEEQEEWYKAAETLFSGDTSVEALFAWEDAGRNGKRIASFHDEKRAVALGKTYRDSLITSAQYDIDAIDGLQDLAAYWTKHATKLKNRTGDSFKDIEQAKDTRKAQLNSPA